MVLMHLEGMLPLSIRRGALCLVRTAHVDRASLFGGIMRRPSLIGLLLTIIGLAVGIATIAGKPPADGFHKGLRQAKFANQ